MGPVMPVDKTRLGTSENDGDTAWLTVIEKVLIFVWCDGSIGKHRNPGDIQNTIVQLANVVNRYRQLVHTFNEASACKEFIEQVNNVCLIISGAMGKDLVPSIHNLEQIDSIYVFCIDRETHELWAKNYPKVKGVFTDIKPVCELLESYLSSLSAIDFYRIKFDMIGKELNSPAGINGTMCFLYSKLSQRILLNMESSDHSIKDMVNYCRSEYTTDYQKRLVANLEQNYFKYSALWWYTKDYFFQGIINYVLGTDDLYALSSMGKLIKDINLQLTQLHQQRKRTNGPLYLFSGHFLSEYDLNKMKKNLGGLMCIKQFVSANPEQAIANLYIEQYHSSKSNGKKIPVLFQLYIDQSVELCVPYANIGSISPFVHEKEYLISMSSVYHIDKIERHSTLSSGLVVKVTLVSTNNIQYQSLLQSIQINKLEHMNLLEVSSTIHNRLHQFKSTHKLFKKTLCYNIQQFQPIIVHYNMAIIYGSLTEYEKSLEEYRHLLNDARTYIPTCKSNDDTCLVPIYSNMALMYGQQHQYRFAIEHGFRALSILGNIQTTFELKKEFESACYYNLGLIHEQQGQISDAQTFYERALSIRQGYLPIGHPDVTSLQRLITVIAAKPT